MNPGFDAPQEWPAATPVDCRILCLSGSAHLSQLFTGFGTLAQMGRVKLSIHKESPYDPGVWGVPFMKVIVNGRLKLFYDMLDADHFWKNGLEWCDLYFKRSYNPARVAAESDGHKIRPYGLFYRVFGSRDFALRRAVWSLLAARTRAQMQNAYLQFLESSALLSRLPRAHFGRAFGTQEQFEASPERQQPPRILFLTRLWRPEHAPNSRLAEERESINRMRAECIRRLRAEFGPQFFGGVHPTQYTLDRFPDLIEDDHQVTRRDNYLRRMRSSSICLAAMGLQGSNGGKLGEYVAASRAIVTERLCYQVPGDFRAGQNYLEFMNADECVAAVRRLADDPDLRYQMMQNNSRYYQQFVRPDRIVGNTLITALSTMAGET